MTTIVIVVLLVIGAIAALIPIAAGIMEQRAHDADWRDR